MTSEQGVILMLSLGGTFIAFLAFLNDRAMERDRKRDTRLPPPAE